MLTRLKSFPKYQARRDEKSPLVCFEIMPQENQSIPVQDSERLLPVSDTETQSGAAAFAFVNDTISDIGTLYLIKRLRPVSASPLLALRRRLDGRQHVDSGHGRLFAWYLAYLTYIAIQQEFSLSNSFSAGTLFTIVIII